MHLVFDGIGVKYGGGAVILVDVLAAACQNPSVERVTAFCSPRATRRFELPESPKLRIVEQDAAERTVTGRMSWLLRGQAAAVAAQRPDAFVSMGGIGLGKMPGLKAMFVQQSLPMCGEALARCDTPSRIRMAAIHRLARASCRSADLVFAQTPTMARWIHDWYGVGPDRIEVVLPWVNCIGLGEEQDGDIAPMAQTPAGRRILYVGSTSPYKNLECIAQAMPEIQRRVPGATAFLTCPPDHPLCRNPGIVGVGYLGGATLQKAYRMATVFVTPSLVESGNLVLVEAMSLGTPVVASDRPYARDVCGEAAVYFEPGRPQELVAAVSRLLENAEERQMRARLGLEAAERGRKLRASEGMIQRIVSRAAGKQ